MIKIIVFHFVVLFFLTGCFSPDLSQEQRNRDSESLRAQELEINNSVPVGQRLQNQILREQNVTRGGNPMNNYNILKREQ